MTFSFSLKPRESLREIVFWVVLFDRRIIENEIEGRVLTHLHEKAPEERAQYVGIIQSWGFLYLIQHSGDEACLK